MRNVSACTCVCATLTGTRTDTRGLVRVHDEPGIAIPALGHGRAVCAGGAGFGITVRASAFCTDKHGFQALVHV